MIKMEIQNFIGAKLRTLGYELKLDGVDFNIQYAIFNAQVSCYVRNLI
jgi:hypothetical protein